MANKYENVVENALNASKNPENHFIVDVIAEIGVTNFTFYNYVIADGDDHKEVLENSSEKLFWNLEGDTFYKLLAGARAIVGNSSAGIREASYFGVKAVNVGKRQEGRERAGNVIDCSPEEVYESLSLYPTTIRQLPSHKVKQTHPYIPHYFLVVPSSFLGK